MANVCADAASSITPKNNMQVLVDKSSHWYKAADIVCMDGPNGVIRTDGKGIVVAGNGEVFGLFDFKPAKTSMEIIQKTKSVVK